MRPKRAADPAARVPEDRRVRRRSHALTTPATDRRIERLSTGRGVEHLTALMNTRLFQVEPQKPAGSPARLPAQPGLFALHGGTHVFIVDVFTRWRVRRADIVPLTAADEQATHFTCVFAECHDLPRRRVA